MSNTKLANTACSTANRISTLSAACLEEEGIFYYFEHEEGKHTMVLGDAKSAFSEIEGATGSDIPYRAPGEAAVELEHISEWNVLHELQTAKVALDDFDFKKPRVDLLKESTITREHAKAEYEYFDYPGLFYEASDGEALAKVRIEEIQSKFKRLVGVADHRAMTPGFLFNLVEYPRTR